MIFMKKVYVLTAVLLLFSGCTPNPLTGKKTMAFVPNSSLFPSSFAQYNEFLSTHTVVNGTADSAMVERVGAKLAEAAKTWLAADGNDDYLSDYQWEYKLVQDDSVNAWCMPGGKIVVYTGILPVTKTETGLAVVLGHEISHALLNHGQQRMSGGVLKQLGAVGLSVGLGLAGVSSEAQELARIAYGIGSEVGGALPFSRGHENEADQYGVILMAIAGYNPDEAVPFWERMAANGGAGFPELLSTHPSDTTRIKKLQGWVPGAKEKAAEFGVSF
jgi:predicted Zn-dependent protease